MKQQSLWGTCWGTCWTKKTGFGNVYLVSTAVFFGLFLDSIVGFFVGCTLSRNQRQRYVSASVHTEGDGWQEVAGGLGCSPSDNSSGSGNPGVCAEDFFLKQPAMSLLTNICPNILWPIYWNMEEIEVRFHLNAGITCQKEFKFCFR